MITHYDILSAPDIEELTKSVREVMEHGWEPLGGVSVAINDFYSEDHKGWAKENMVTIFAQAMVKKVH